MSSNEWPPNPATAASADDNGGKEAFPEAEMAESIRSFEDIAPIEAVETEYPSLDAGEAAKARVQAEREIKEIPEAMSTSLAMVDGGFGVRVWLKEPVAEGVLPAEIDGVPVFAEIATPATMDQARAAKVKLYEEFPHDKYPGIAAGLSGLGKDQATAREYAAVAVRLQRSVDKIIPSQIDGVPIDLDVIGRVEPIFLTPETIQFVLTIGAVTLPAIKALYGMLTKFMSVKKGEGVIIKNDLFGDRSVKEIYENWENEWKPKLMGKLQGEGEMVKYRQDRKKEIVSLAERKVAALQKAGLPQEGPNSIDEFLEEKILKARVRLVLFESSDAISDFVNTLPLSDASKKRNIAKLVMAYEEKSIGKDEKDIRGGLETAPANG